MKCKDFKEGMTLYYLSAPQQQVSEAVLDYIEYRDGYYGDLDNIYLLHLKGCDKAYVSPLCPDSTGGYIFKSREEALQAGVALLQKHVSTLEKDLADAREGLDLRRNELSIIRDAEKPDTLKAAIAAALQPWETAQTYQTFVQTLENLYNITEKYSEMHQWIANQKKNHDRSTEELQFHTHPSWFARWAGEYGYKELSEAYVQIGAFWDEQYMPMRLLLEDIPDKLESVLSAFRKLVTTWTEQASAPITDWSGCQEGEELFWVKDLLIFPVTLTAIKPAPCLAIMVSVPGGGTAIREVPVASEYFYRTEAEADHRVKLMAGLEIVAELEELLVKSGKLLRTMATEDISTSRGTETCPEEERE